MKIPVFIIILLFFLAANIYVYQRIWTAMPPNSVLRSILIAVAALTLSSFILAALVGEHLPIPITSFLYTIGASWMLISIYFILAFLFQDLILFANKFLHFAPAKLSPQLARSNWAEMLFIFAFIALLITGGYLRYLKKDRIHLPIQLTKNMGDSISQKSLRVVAISDLHLGYTIGNNELEKWVSLVNQENPDMILIAGDLIDNSLRPVIHENLARTLRQLKAPMGVYACPGNHEYIGSTNIKELFQFYEDANIKLLRDSYVEVDSALYIVGRDDRSNSNRKELADIIKNIDLSKPIILLDHQPYDLHLAEENKIDLQISGHTHQGQIWPISMITSWMYELDHGYKKKGDTHYYVSSGIGIWGGKFRIGTASEYVVIDINKTGQ